MRAALRFLYPDVWSRFWLGALIGTLLVVTPVSAQEEEPPWRLSPRLGLPEGLRISGSERLRIEYLAGELRPEQDGDRRGLFSRLLALVEYEQSWLKIGAELEDSRGYDFGGKPSLAVLSSRSGHNAVELLQAFVQIDFTPDPTPATVRTSIRGGRLTLNLGSRRFVARNRFRNTINAFTGGIGEVRGEGYSVSGFYLLPIDRRPLDLEELEDNRIEFDREDEEVALYGFFAEREFSEKRLNLELFFYGLSERDASDRATRNRELYTPGFRIFRNPSRSSFDFEFESAIQVGQSRSSSAPTNRTDLDHTAYFVHLATGYTFARPGNPRLLFQWDYASGDRDPDDTDNERFDTLYGARRFDFGPTGIFGAFARGNINAPGARLQFEPSESVQSFIGYRAFWLAERRDAWVGTGLRDPTGNSGRFIGHQIEFRVRWDWIPQVVRLEAGAAALIRGEFARDVPGGPQGNEPLYFYTQTTIQF